MRKTVLWGACIVIALSAIAWAQQPSGEEALLAKAKTIHERAITIDTHVDISGADYATAELDPGTNTRLKCDLVKMKAGGLDGVFLAVYVGQNPALNAEGYKRAYDQAMVKFEAIHRLAEKMHPDKAEIALTPDDVVRIEKTGKRVILIGIENGYTVGEDLSLIKKYYDLGTRYITLTHSGHNQIADSAGPREPMHNGLSAFGRKVVAEMNRLGIMIDVSHIATKSYWDLIEASKAPIIASHSGCAALAPNARNLDDDQLRALAKNGGVIQVVALASYLKADSPERAAAISKLREELGMGGGRGGGGGATGGAGGRGGAGAQPPQQQMTAEQQAEMAKRRAQYDERMKEVNAKYPTASIKEFVDHIDHAVKVAGIDHVGVGTDFDGGGGIPGFNDHSEALNVTVELVRRGYTEEQIRKIWGGNLLRVWREVRKVAGQS
ncbi:MAG: membrane dipeptidase [Acidobacteria bacterium]|nr:MAG: membrane dipeptidase [Acidobacteriota bacterium]